MPTRKQRKRQLKERRHEYETVWVDSEGNELEEPPDDVPVPARERREDPKKPQQKRQQSAPRGRQPRTRPDPLPPSWRRALRRSLILGVVILVFFTLVSGLLAAFFFAAFYTAMFIPFTYYLDRFAYRRWLRRTAGQPKKR